MLDACAAASRGRSGTGQLQQLRARGLLLPARRPRGLRTLLRLSASVEPPEQPTPAEPSATSTTTTVDLVPLGVGPQAGAATENADVWGSPGPVDWDGQAEAETIREPDSSGLVLLIIALLGASFGVQQLIRVLGGPRERPPAPVGAAVVTAPAKSAAPLRPASTPEAYAVAAPSQTPSQAAPERPAGAASAGASASEAARSRLLDVTDDDDWDLPSAADAAAAAAARTGAQDTAAPQAPQQEVMAHGTAAAARADAGLQAVASNQQARAAAGEQERADKAAVATTYDPAQQPATLAASTSASTGGGGGGEGSSAAGPMGSDQGLAARSSIPPAAAPLANSSLPLQRAQSGEDALPGAARTREEALSPAAPSRPPPPTALPTAPSERWWLQADAGRGAPSGGGMAAPQPSALSRSGSELARERPSLLLDPLASPPRLPLPTVRPEPLRRAPDSSALAHLPPPSNTSVNAMRERAQLALRAAAAASEASQRAAAYAAAASSAATRAAEAAERAAASATTVQASLEDAAESAIALAEARVVQAAEAAQDAERRAASAAAHATAYQDAASSQADIAERSIPATKPAPQGPFDQLQQLWHSATSAFAQGHSPGSTQRIDGRPGGGSSGASTRGGSSGASGTGASRGTPGGGSGPSTSASAVAADRSVGATVKGILSWMGSDEATR